MNPAAEVIIDAHTGRQTAVKPARTVTQQVCGFCHRGDGEPGVTFVNTTRGQAHWDCPKATDAHRQEVREARAQFKAQEATARKFKRGRK